jgi:hypothetical protein
MTVEGTIGVLRRIQTCPIDVIRSDRAWNMSQMPINSFAANPVEVFHEILELRMALHCDALRMLEKFAYLGPKGSYYQA